MELSGTRAAEAENEALIRDIYERYKRLMYRIAYESQPDPASVEDLVQESLVRLIGSVETIRTIHERALPKYIESTVRNTAFNFRARQEVRARHAADDDPGSVECAEAPSPEELLLLAERASELSADLSRLPEVDRLLLEGKYILELSDAELAAMLGCKPGSIRMKLTRARRRALALMTKEGSCYG